MKEYALYFMEIKSLLDDMIFDMQEKYVGKTCRFYYGMFDVYEGVIVAISHPGNTRIEMKIKILDSGYTVYLDAIQDKYEIL